MVFSCMNIPSFMVSTVSGHMGCWVLSIHFQVIINSSEMDAVIHLLLVYLVIPICHTLKSQEIVVRTASAVIGKLVC